MGAGSISRTPTSEAITTRATLTAVLQQAVKADPAFRAALDPGQTRLFDQLVDLLVDAAEAGKQVAVLVPTTILADQHARTFAQHEAIAVDVPGATGRCGKSADRFPRLIR